MADLIQIVDGELYKKLTAVERLVKEKLLIDENLLTLNFDNYTNYRLIWLSELITSLFGDSAHLADNFIHLVRVFFYNLLSLVDHAQTYGRDHKEPLDIKRFKCFAQAALEAVTVVNDDGKQVLLVRVIKGRTRYLIYH